MADEVLMRLGAGTAVGLEAPLVPVPAAIGGMSVARSVVMGIARVGLPAVMREAGQPLDRIGLVSLTLLPRVLEGLWSGAVERDRLPPAGRRRMSASVACGAVLSALALAAGAGIGPAAFAPLLVCLIAAALANAAIGSACDGFAVETLPAGHRGRGNAAQAGVSFLGLPVGGALLLDLIAAAGRTAASLVRATPVLGLSQPFLVRASAPRRSASTGPASRRRASCRARRGRPARAAARPAPPCPQPERPWRPA
ncbi:hypothetical protein QA634_00785 [Methylobacterium sp. CB376]|uniref:hypothetical protein n=1 Tax=unclassified Methylobacterium TaxID=2615210 RepID=UPI000323C5BA|nr:MULTISPECIES: hypothetical protein [Methylobacterium]WFT80490.1 hypothetical protein QA634_00785 [Methylobacterium nodulans]